MARLVPFCLVLLLAAAGCRHRLALVPCDESATHSGSAAATTSTLSPSGSASDVDVQMPKEIRVQAPPQKITVTLPPECGSGCAPGPQHHVMPPAAAPAPGAPVMMAPAAAPAYAPMAPAPALMSSEQTVRPRTRIALGFDIIRVPIPCPKLFAVQGEQEVVTRQTYQMPAAAPVMAAPVMAAPVAAAPVAYAPAPVAYAPAPVAYAPAPAAPAPVYAPLPAPAAPAMICVPGPTPCAPEDCQTDAKPGRNHPLLNHLSQMKHRLDGIERDYWKRAQPAAVTTSPGVVVLPAPREAESGDPE